MNINGDNSIFSILDKQLNIFDTYDKSIVIINVSNILDPYWKEQDFSNFVNSMKANKYKEKINNQCLEVIDGENILKIENIANITNYCNFNNYKKLTDTKWIKRKTLFKENIDDLIDYNIDFLAEEETEGKEPENWEITRKKYKLIRTLDYEITENIIYRVNILKINDIETYTFKQSRITKEDQVYQFQIILNKKIKKEDLFKNVIKILQSITLIPIILTKQHQKKILDEYYELVKKDILIKNKGTSIPLLAPKPTTLELDNLIDPSDYGGEISILSNYTVTEKADGERYLMYINNEGEAYIINNTYNVYGTNILSEKLKNSLIDGEYVMCTDRIDGKNKNIFASFDMYYINGKKITNLGLMSKEKEETRYSFLLQTEEELNKKENVFIQYLVKKMYYSDNILKDCDTILSNKENINPYSIDGLIFTPAKLAVYSYYENKIMPITDNQRWDRVFKWKPPEQNTIDFLIKYVKDITINGEKYKEFNLYCGYNFNNWENLEVIDALKIIYDKEANKKYKLKQSDSYVPILFKPTIYYENGVDSVYLKYDSKNNILAENNQHIKDNTIVEFRYINNKDIPVSNRWVPIKVRDDKTRLYQGGQLSKTANDLEVALNVWRTIHNPISRTVITGNKEISSVTKRELEELKTNDVYYVRNIPREALLSFNMLNFHNQIIKRSLYHNLKKKSKLLELCCGEFGDMSRFIDAGFNFVLGIDFVKKNIVNPKTGAWSRIIRKISQYNKGDYRNKTTNIDMVALVGDCSIPINDGSAAKVLNEKESEIILKNIFNKNINYSIQPYLKNIAGKGAGGFETVSTQFAIHYFFESEEKLNGFLTNVSENLKKDGVFICTFMDGRRVQEEIKNNGGDLIEGKKKTNEEKSLTEVPVWAIIRKYDKDQEEIKYGKKINVFIETTKGLIPEYLVNFDLLIEKCKEFNLELTETEMFGETFNKIKEGKKKNEILEEFDKETVLKRFSFLNRWAIFTKV